MFLGAQGIEKVGCFEWFVVRKKWWKPCLWDQKFYSLMEEAIAIKEVDVTAPKDFDNWITTFHR